MKQILIAIVVGVVYLGVSLILMSSVAGAQGAQDGGAISGIDSARGTGVPTNLVDGDGSIVSRVINIFLYIVGVVSVIMLIYGGFRYVISGGQKEAITSAKNTILYAIVGLLIAIFAYAIIRFVLGAALGLDGGTDI